MGKVRGLQPISIQNYLSVQFCSVLFKTVQEQNRAPLLSVQFTLLSRE
jgi:hypothetical protein